jgi:hypothetical protein
VLGHIVFGMHAPKQPPSRTHSPHVTNSSPACTIFRSVNYQSEMALKPLTFVLLSCLIVAALGQGKEGASGERRSAPSEFAKRGLAATGGCGWVKTDVQAPSLSLNGQSSFRAGSSTCPSQCPVATACACYHSIFATNTDQFPLQEGFADSCGCFYAWLRPGTSTPFTVSVWTYCS